MDTIKYERAIIANSGMGGAFYPPAHPMHTHSVETDLNRKKKDRGSMSLEYALTQEYISPQLFGYSLHYSCLFLLVCSYLNTSISKPYSNVRTRLLPSYQ
jgi:hypothetical protein